MPLTSLIVQTAGAGGNFSIYDVASKKVVHTFAWPDGASSAGQNVPIDPPTTSTKTKVSEASLREQADRLMAFFFGAADDFSNHDETNHDQGPDPDEN